MLGAISTPLSEQRAGQAAPESATAPSDQPSATAGSDTGVTGVILLSGKTSVSQVPGKMLQAPSWGQADSPRLR